MPTPGTGFQAVNQRAAPDRVLHVWYRLKGTARWKCVLCGGVSRTPSDEAVPDYYEPLTDEERAMCPPLPT